MPTKTELIARWDAFLHKMKQRYSQSLQQAVEACVVQLEETHYDYYTVFRLWQGMNTQSVITHTVYPKQPDNDKLFKH